MKNGILASVREYAKHTVTFRGNMPKYVVFLYAASDRGNSTSKYVKLWQRLMKGIGLYVGSIDGAFGSLTIKATYAFQKLKNLKMDCIVGPVTWSSAIPVAFEIRDSLVTFTVKQIEYRYRGVEAYFWQNLLAGDGYYTGQVDQTFGDVCKAATLQYQKDKGLVADCKVGPKTWAKGIGV